MREPDNQPDDGEPPVHALRASTGTGKTQLAAQVTAESRQGNGADKPPVFFAVPTHRLGDDVAAHFRAHALTAKVFRGRSAPVPGRPEQTMCLNLKQVDLAIACGEPVSETCCKKDKKHCMFYGTCAYQAQLAGSQPDVWIGAHEMLFHEHKGIGGPDGEISYVFIDEAFWEAGLRTGQGGIRVEDIRNSIIGRKGKEEDAADLDALRNKLAAALALQAEPGGLMRKCLIETMTHEDCTNAIRLEWKLMPPSDLFPGMPQASMQATEDRLGTIRFARHMITIWGAVRELIDRPEIEISGHLYFEHEHGKPVIKWRGITPIREQWKVPTMIMDATLPGLPILQVFYPTVEIVGEIDVEMPHTHVRQVLDAPVSKNHLLQTASDINRNAVRRCILQRWVELGRESTLVVCQLEYDTWLKASGLPESIAVEHFNNVEGIDRYKDVRLLIAVGRTATGPEAVEALASALTGVEPKRATARPNGPHRWYDQVMHGINVGSPSGRGPAVRSDKHPDETCEAIRFQITEAKLVQAIGRGRGVNRTPETPLDIDIVCNVVLPVIVDEVVDWRVPSTTIETVVEGVVLTSPVDMVRLWPKVWPNEKAAYRAMEPLQDFVRRSAKIERRSPGVGTL
jgi:putative DNA primase/helicase